MSYNEQEFTIHNIYHDKKNLDERCEFCGLYTEAYDKMFDADNRGFAARFVTVEELIWTKKPTILER